MDNKTSDKKQAQIDAYLNRSIQPGDWILVSDRLISGYGDGEKIAKVISIDPVRIEVNGKKYKANESIPIKKYTRYVGANSFINDDAKTRVVSFDINSILHTAGILSYKSDNDRYNINGTVLGESNWNPYIYDKSGNKVRYQRDFVWNVDDNRLLIDSIYAGAECGKIILRKREYSELEALYKKGERELYFSDIVDGKQRLNALRGFVNDEYTDSNGDHFSDLSDSAQNMFYRSMCFVYVEMRNATDAQVISQFLKTNHLGRPQSREHIEFVMRINRNMI